jgi:GT2 family glycosyltransferase
MAETAGACCMYSLVIPTYDRPEMLFRCLEHLAALDYPLDRVEVLVIDNGGPERTSAAVGRAFEGRLPLRYLVNKVNRGMGFSLKRGMRESRGGRAVLLNDDALVPPSFLRGLDATFAADPAVGCVGCRADERGYARQGSGIGRIDPAGEVVGNFDQDCGRTIEVEHVYGFCYAFTRGALVRAGAYDEVLLARPYSSANRTETDHCLSIREAGLKVVYNPAIVVRHLAKRRAGMSEVSFRWKPNHTRNTLCTLSEALRLLRRAVPRPPLRLPPRRRHLLSVQAADPLQPRVLPYRSAGAPERLRPLRPLLVWPENRRA